MATKQQTTLTHVRTNELEELVGGTHGNPFAILGPHVSELEGQTKLAVRVWIPGAAKVWLIPRDAEKTAIEFEKAHDAGYFECLIGPVGTEFRYGLRVEDGDGQRWEAEDPYRFGRVLTDFDLHLLGEGSHYKNYEKLGAHKIELDGVSGVHFAVWAPNAARVSVVGDFNNWDGRRHGMRHLGASGIWEIFLPGLCEGDIYKFEILTAEHSVLLKGDPYGTATEVRPKTANVVFDIEQYAWRDDNWLHERRAARNALDAPMSIYEVHLGSWKRGEGNHYISYRDLATDLIPYAKDMGFTHIELLPILEHPFDGSWGYQALGYFAPTSRFGTPTEFMRFVDACHQADLGVILDWVPAHFPRDEHGLRNFDGTQLFEHADPRQGEHRDWGTMIFNYGRNEVSNFLLGNALFWLDKYHLDGFRVDAVASMLYLDYSKEDGDWIPNKYGGKENIEAIDFLRRFNELCHAHHPGVLTIAEESTAWNGVSRPTYAGGLGFSLKWNMGWMNDVLEYFSKDSIYRKYHHQNLTFAMLYAYSENFLLPVSHDEVVHGKRSLLDKMPGDGWQKFANLRAFFGFQFAFPGKKLIFMGSEFAQGREWDCDQSLDWHLLDVDAHRGVHQLVRDLNRLYQREKALHEVDFHWDGFEWIDCNDAEQSVVSFLRRGHSHEDEVVVLLNLTPTPRYNYRIGVPRSGYYREILNTDSELYGGSNLGNGGGTHAEATPMHNQGWSLELTLPPLSCLILKRA